MKLLSNGIKSAKDNLTLAKANQERNANKSHRKVEFNVGDKVLLNSYHVNLASQALQTSKKLQHQFIGPYIIAAKISPVTYKLDLPHNLQIHLVFHVSLLQPYQDPASINHRPNPTPPPPAITVNDHVEYEVENILDHRTRHHCKEFLVKWTGYPKHDATWEPENHLQNAENAIQDYLASRMLLEGEGSNVMGLHVSMA